MGCADCNYSGWYVGFIVRERCHCNTELPTWCTVEGLRPHTSTTPFGFELNKAAELIPDKALLLAANRWSEMDIDRIKQLTADETAFLEWVSGIFRQWWEAQPNMAKYRTLTKDNAFAQRTAP